MKYSRRALTMLLPIIASAQKASKKLPSQAIKFEDMPVKTGGENKTRAILDGETHSGFPVEVHETELPAGGSPHAPHRHVSEEMFLVQDGLLDAFVEGKTTRLTAGSVLYVNSNELHGVSNPGPSRSRYFVVALGAKS